MRVGIDIEQFVRDTYGSGIQRVLQYLAKDWPSDDVAADFVVPVGDHLAALSPEHAAEMLSIPFRPREPNSDLRFLVRDHLAGLDLPRIEPGELVSTYDAWLLPEVSYLPSVLERFESFVGRVPTVMIGYDTLPMSEPANYRFKPGSAAWVSEYFRHLAAADSVVCISDYARDSIMTRLRRDPKLATSVAHPGGDHLAIRAGNAPGRPLFARLGTMEARKRPLEILAAFVEAVSAHGAQADLLFVGGPSASDEAINSTVRQAAVDGHPVRWVQGAADGQVLDLLNESSAFLSIGTEGYGIPVLEAIRMGTPVLYDGVQPAGDIMQGRGARRVAAMAHDDMVAMFIDFSVPNALAGLRAEVSPGAVPTWAGFARDVAFSVPR